MGDPGVTMPPSPPRSAPPLRADRCRCRCRCRCPCHLSLPLPPG